MGQIKCTKVELVRLKKKLQLFQKYLPTLQLKKMLLQMEVNKARDELKQLEARYREEKDLAYSHAHLLTDRAGVDVEKALKIEERITNVESIAGIQVPVLDRLRFVDLKYSLIRTPAWLDSVIDLMQKLTHTYHKVLVGKEKKEILERELRTVSIRVNLFEKRLIPDLERKIGQIRVFLGDQELQAVGQAKVSKAKSLKRKREA